MERLGNRCRISVRHQEYVLMFYSTVEQLWLTAKYQIFKNIFNSFLKDLGKVDMF